MIKFIKSNYKYLVFVFGIIILNLFLILDKFSSSSFLVPFLINLVYIIVFAFIFWKYEKIRVEYMYLIIIIPLSLFFFLSFPLNKIPDEGNHLLRAYEISYGNLVTHKHKWDVSLYKILISKNYGDVLESSKVKNANYDLKYNYDNTSLYSFVCYIPQALGIKFARMVGLNTFYQAYAGRLFNLAVFIAMMFFAIKLIPYKKVCIFIISFLPIVLQEAVSLSPDALTIASATLLVSSVLYFKSRKDEKFTKGQLIYLSVLSIVLSFCKIVYLPICLILFLLPKEKFSSSKKKNIFITLLFIFIMVVNLSWLCIASQFLPDNDNINSKMQLQYIFGHIFNYINILFKTNNKLIHDNIFNSLGMTLGLLKIELSYLYMIPLMIVVVLLYLTNNYEKIDISKLDKGLMIFILLSIILLMYTSLYLQWTPVGNQEILGIQGRYFVPLFPLLAFIITKIKITPKINWNNKYLYMFLVGLNSYALACIVFNFL